MITTQTTSLPFGFYVHVPWCRRRCPYCDFYFEIKKNLLGNGFAQKILLEWAQRDQQEQQAATLYFGGGTPSLLDPEEINAIINGLATSLATDAEITLELNPEDMRVDYLGGLSQTRINRLSVGIQSFCPVSLKYLGRKHRAEQAQEAIAQAVTNGFKNISIDLIIGVSGEDTELIKKSLAWAVHQGITHISMYMLTVEPGTNLEKMIGRGTRNAINDDNQVTAYEHMREFIQSLGFQQYEISSFALNDHFSRHNIIYWSNGSYMGLGPGAHSMRLLSDGSVERRANAPDLNEWWKDPAAQAVTTEIMAPAAALKEALAFGIRNMRTGIDPIALAHRHQIALPDNFSGKTQELIQANWLSWCDSRLRLTSHGALFADAVSRAFLGL